MPELLERVDLLAQLEVARAEGGEPRRVVVALLEELQQPSVLVLEDVHWADQATLDVLRLLGRRIVTTPSFVVATYRDDEVEGDHPLRVVLGELASASSVTRAFVPRLSLSAVAELAEPLERDAEAICRLTSGNAFYVTEILASSGDLLPATVRDAVLARAARLPSDVRQLLEVIAAGSRTTSMPTCSRPTPLRRRPSDATRPRSKR